MTAPPLSSPPRTWLGAPASGFQIAARIPHDTTAFTQGLVWHDGTLFESTGLYGHSQVRRVDPATGVVRQAVSLPPDRFGEGLTLLRGRLYQLTWEHEVGYVYDASDLAKIGSFRYRGEGWGLTTDGHHLIMSDGSETLRFMDPETGRVTRRLAVRFPTRASVSGLNEVQWIRGEIFANVYPSDRIVRIDASTGIVREVLDFAGIPAEDRGGSADDVLNGIAFDQETGHVFVTGKRWRAMFWITLVS